MIVERLWLNDFRNHRNTDIELDPAVTLVVGPNGHGKTNLLEAIGMLAGMRSFRGATPDALIGTDADAAIVRAQVRRGDRELLVEMEIAQGRSRAQVNRQAVRRETLGIVDRAYILHDGMMIMEGSAEAIVQDENVKQVYLGEDFRLS